MSFEVTCTRVRKERTKEQDKGRREGLKGYISINCLIISLISKISSQLNGYINPESFHPRNLL